MPVPARWRLAALTSLLVVAVACAAPPTRELSLAEGAIEAARAAGAATFATEEFTAAEQTLARARADVVASDYRAALSHALEANTQAQEAARMAPLGRVRARLAAGKTLDAYAVRIERVESQLASDEAKRVPAAVRRSASAELETALARLQSTRAALERGELAAVDDIPEATAALDATLARLTPPPVKRPRSRR